MWYFNGSDINDKKCHNGNILTPIRDTTKLSLDLQKHRSMCFKSAYKIDKTYKLLALHVANYGFIKILILLF